VQGPTYQELVSGRAAGVTIRFGTATVLSIKIHDSAGLI
jgi:hypothetical protein